jgi:hypothetical protein
VPPIYQPEVAANAIVWAAEHADRELYVGASTVMAIVGNKVVPGLADRYLARTGFASQQTDGAPAPDRPDNLFAPADETRDHGAHGEFDARARSRSYQLWARMHRRWLAAGAVGLAGVALAAVADGGSRRKRAGA